MYWLGYDLETTGLNVKEERITEVGAVLWDVKEKKPVEVYNALVKIDRPLTPAIVKLTGLTDDILSKHGKSFVDAVKGMFELATHATHYVAHNGSLFDQPFLKEECVRNGVTFLERPLIDSSVDVPYPAEISTRKLVHLAAEHNFLNPYAHRAVFDVLTMMTVVSKYDSEEIIRYSESPNVTIRAMVEYADRAKASTKGYRWDGEKKFWTKTIKGFQLEKEKQESTFEIKELKNV
jgi:DNA polymerase III epsilon subunit-like protein